jgi:hypothetical protein
MIAQEPVHPLLAFQFEVRMELPEGQRSELMLQSPAINTWN